MNKYFFTEIRFLSIEQWGEGATEHLLTFVW